MKINSMYGILPNRIKYIVLKHTYTHNAMTRVRQIFVIMTAIRNIIVDMRAKIKSANPNVHMR